MVKTVLKMVNCRQISMGPQECAWTQTKLDRMRPTSPSRPSTPIKTITFRACSSKQVGNTLSILCTKPWATGRHIWAGLRSNTRMMNQMWLVRRISKVTIIRLRATTFHGQRKQTTQPSTATTRDWSKILTHPWGREMRGSSHRYNHSFKNSS